MNHAQAKVAKMRKLIEAVLELEPDEPFYIRTVEDRLKWLRSEMANLQKVINIPMHINERYEVQCSGCGHEWEEDDGHCAWCGAEMEIVR